VKRNLNVPLAHKSRLLPLVPWMNALIARHTPRIALANLVTLNKIRLR
jgi:hypothetical protein